MPLKKGAHVSQKVAREKLLQEQKAISLADINSLVETKSQFRELFHPSEKLWTRYFQSPVDKAARMADKDFAFNAGGALENPAAAEKFLAAWLGLEAKSDANRQAVAEWLNRGAPLPGDTIDLIAKKLADETLTNHALYNQPLCRLVRGDQLRYDPHYQAIYQLTPGQSRLIYSNNSDAQSGAVRRLPLEQVDRNRRVYWGIAEVFQSLVAMFDSDLGSLGEEDSARRRNDPQDGRRPGETKEFIRIEFEDFRPHEFIKRGKAAPDIKNLTPAELNEFSPLRFWAPPPVFARCVFHMIFWKSVITNRDLYGRTVIRDEPPGLDVVERIRLRVNYYKIIVNWFNAAQYRLARYDELFRALLILAREISKRYSDPATELGDRGDVELWRDGREMEALFFTSGLSRASGPYRLDNSPRTSLKLPFKTIHAHRWELASAYRQRGPTRASDFLLFLRDRALEVILWSKYQMEIRSIGTIPVQYLYRPELTERGLKQVVKLVKLYEAAQVSPENYAEINDRVFEAIKAERIDGWVELKKVFGGLHRESVERDRLTPETGMSWLANPPRRARTLTARRKQHDGGQES